MGGEFTWAHQDWDVCRIGEIAKVKGGKRLPKGKGLINSITSHPYLRIVDFSDGRIDHNCLQYVPEDVFPSISRYIISKKDIYISIVGTIGLVGKVDESLDGASLTENAAKICEISPAVCRDFLLAFLHSYWGQEEIKSQTVGSTQPKLAIFRIKDIRVPLPPLPEQRAIAEILGSLDDKIELNRRMNRALEGMARAIFKAWFIDFEPVKAKADGATSFPGMPQEIFDQLPTRLVESELGPIPEGWEVQPLEVICTFLYGKALKAKDRHGGNIPVYGSNGIVGWHDEALVDGPGIVVGRKGNPGTVSWSFTDFYPIDTTFFVVPARDGIRLSFLRYALDYMGLESFGSDSAVPGLSRNMAYGLPVIVPQRELIKVFNALFYDIYAMLQATQQESRVLAALRDTLLPKLISGEIRVGAADLPVRGPTQTGRAVGRALG